MIEDPDFCNSSFLTFRYVATDGIGWKAGMVPVFPVLNPRSVFPVGSASEILNRLRQITESTKSDGPIGLLLSSGIDSAIIAALLPKDTRAYTVRFTADWEVDEAAGAARTCSTLGISHRIVRVGWQDYLDNMDHLMQVKKAPLHPSEIGLYLAARTARADGVETLFVGNGADSTFGGMDKLLGRDWTFDEFVARYTFVPPSSVLMNPRSMLKVFEPYRVGNGVDVLRFLKTVHGLGVIQTFENAVHAAGCRMVAPFEQLLLAVPLDIRRIRHGEPKYLLREVFHRLYPDAPPPPQDKLAFARPMERWMSGIEGPSRREFLSTSVMNGMTGEQKWLVFCLERFLKLIEKPPGV